MGQTKKDNCMRVSRTGRATRVPEGGAMMSRIVLDVECWAGREVACGRGARRRLRMWEKDQSFPRNWIKQPSLSFRMTKEIFVISIKGSFS